MKFLILLLMSTAALANDAVQDPWEELNRSTFSLNQTLDETIFEPVAISYKQNTPQTVQNRVSDFSSNIEDIGTLGNELLQFELFDGAKSFGRVLINSTIGLFGLFDVASNMGLEKTEEDFGQTLAVWGTPPGHYLVLPVLGPSTLRGAAGKAMDMTQNTAVSDRLNHAENLAITGVTAVDARVKLLPATDILKNSDDAYIAARSAYLQKRQFDVYDGNVPMAEEDGF